MNKARALTRKTYLELDELPELMVEAIGALTTKLNGIPEHERESARLLITEMDDDYGYGLSRTATIEWIHIETEAEIIEREQRAEAQAKERERAKEARQRAKVEQQEKARLAEIAAYRHLREKYGDNV